MENGLPGVSLHVQQGDISTSVVAGVANRDTGEPITTDSLFPIASVGKMYEAVGYIKDVDIRFQPGEAYEYSNTNYVLLGASGASNRRLAQRSAQTMGA